MSKQGEINYLKNLGKEGIKHSINRPFSEDICGGLMAELGAIMSLLPPPPKKILDLGCGTGWTSRFFAKKEHKVIGIDISKDAIKYAKIKKNQEKIKNLKFFVGDYENMNFDREFDCVTFIDSLHHSINEEEAIRMAYRALKPGGICIVSEPGIGHRNSPTAINAVKKYGVTEKDILPKLIIKHGKKAGFKKFKIYPRACYINIALYLERNKIPRFNFLKKLFQFNFIRTLAAIFVIIFYKRYDGIVLMIK